MEDPHIATVYLLSDNAGCYHNTELILGLKAMGDRHGVVFSRYDFSDPQSGKDVCDRRIASMKTHIRHWVNEVHGEMKIALESHGVRGCRFTVVEINKENLNAEVSKMPGISFLNNFQLNENGIRAWKAYQVGKGKYYPYSSVITKAQRNTEIKVLVPFSSRSGCPGTVAAASLDSPGLFSCLEEDCVKMFSTYEDLQHHLDTECHIFMEEQDTAYDIIKKKWASILTSVSLPNQGSLSQIKTSFQSDVRNQPTFKVGLLKPSKSQPGCLRTSGPI